MTPQRFTSSYPFSPHHLSNIKLPSRTMIISVQRRCGVVTLRTVQVLLKLVLTLAACYFVVAWPPLHWFYDPASPAGPLSVYIPGGGFSGFWFHLGYLQSMKNLNDYDYYCFSSGCLGVLAAFMNHSVDNVMDKALWSQERWRNQNISRFDLVQDFFDSLVPPTADNNNTIDDNDDDDNQQSNQQLLKVLLPKLKILVTTKSNGLEILEASSRDELLDLMIKTTWVPVLTGRGILFDDQDLYLDGGFSRFLHPECEYRLDLPVTWETVVHTFTPSLTEDTIRELWRTGYGYEHDRFPKRNDELFSSSDINNFVVSPL